MSPTDWISLAAGILTVILIPMLAITIRGVVKWTRLEDRLLSIAKEFNQIVANEEKVHSELYSQMREDRLATNQRLRWLEEYLWRPRSLPSRYICVIDL